MGFRFRKSFKIMPGIRVNFSKSGASVSVGGKGLTANFSGRGTRTTVSIPGTGVSYSETTTNARNTNNAQQRISTQATATPPRKPSPVIGFFLLFSVLFLVIGFISKSEFIAITSGFVLLIVSVVSMLKK